jgi:type I restriction enzyme S subunit
MRKMKDSGVEWLGDIPEGWVVQPLWAHFRRTKKTGFPGETLLSAYRDHGVIPKDSRSDNHNVESADLNGYQLVEDGDLVVNKMKAWQGSLSISKIRGIVSPAYYVFSPESSSVSAGYIHNLLRCVPYVLSYSLISKGVRVGQWDLQPELFRKTPVLVPPMKEQLEIASYLDQETSQIDALISKKEQLIEKLLERRQAVITQVVTKGLDPNVPMKDSGVEWLGEVPEAWMVKKLGRVAKFHNGRELERSDSGHYPVYGSGGIFSWSDEAQNSSEMPSVLFGRKGTVDKPILAVGPFSCVDTMYWTSFTPGVDARFVYYLATAFPYKEVSTATALPSMTSSALKSVPICLPDHQEQLKIADLLDEETTQIDTLVEKTRKAIELLKERRQALITQVVTGKIDVRGFAGGNS